jgi:hypothetical protein
MTLEPRVLALVSLAAFLQGGVAHAAEAAPTPPPPTAESILSALSAIPIKFYGVLKPTFVLSNGVESFTQPNASAITAAVNPVMVEDAGAANSTFQVAQSRLGLTLGEGLAVKGQLEVDFIHFDIASPTVGAYPRLRLASVEWEPLKGHKLFLGQGWDVFSPLNPHTNSIVSVLLQAGNAGFLRQQVAWTSTLGGVEVVAALGLPTANNGSAVGNLEYGLVPTAVARLSYRHDKMIWVGTSWLATAHRITKPADQERRRVTLMGNVFLDVSAGPVNFKAEAYAGQNGANAGLLTLSTGRYDRDVRELGGYLSVRQSLGDWHAVLLSAGAATVLDRNDVVPGYVPATATAKAARNGVGMDHNALVRAAYMFSPLKWVSFFVEPFVAYTRHHLAPADEARFMSDRVGMGLESGAMLKF